MSLYFISFCEIQTISAVTLKEMLAVLCKLGKQATWPKGGSPAQPAKQDALYLNISISRELKSEIM
jgi:hypothetical protein